MKFEVHVDHNGVPGLHILADTKGEKTQLKALDEDFNKAQLIAIRKGMADRYNACGSFGGVDGLDSVHVSLLLGGFPHHITWPDEADKQAKVTISVEGSQGAVEGRVKDLIKGLIGDDDLLGVNLM